VRTEWDDILSEHHHRKATESLTDDGRRNARVVDETALLIQIREWIVRYALPGSANPLYRLTVEDGTAHARPWIRVRFAMRDAEVDNDSGHSTLTFSVSDDVLVCVPDLSPCFRDPVTPDARFPSEAELPDILEVSALHVEWAIDMVQDFVRAALARQ